MSTGGLNGEQGYEGERVQRRGQCLYALCGWHDPGEADDDRG